MKHQRYPFLILVSLLFKIKPEQHTAFAHCSLLAHIAPHRTTLHRTTPHRTTSHRTTPLEE
jgi:hypothetical protein